MRRVGWIATLVVASLAGRARAAPSVRLSLAANEAQDLEATIVGAGVGRPIDRFTIRDPAEHAAPVFATRIRSYAEAGEPVAVAIVMEGDDTWIGNTGYAGDDDERFDGALVGVEMGIDAMNLAARTPRGSTATLIAYASRAEVVWPTSPMSALNDVRFGMQLDYAGHRGDALLEGARAGLAALAHSPLPRKALIVIGDGNDTDNARASATFAQLRDDALAGQVEMFAVVYEPRRARPGAVITQLVPDARTVTSAAALSEALREISDELCDRIYVTFPSASLGGDGTPRALVVSLGDEDLAPVVVTLPDRTSSFGTPAVLVLVALLTGAWWGILRRRRKRRRPAGVS